MYKIVWTPIIEEILHLEREDGNHHGNYAEAVMENDQRIGHVSRISRVL